MDSISEAAKVALQVLEAVRASHPELIADNMPDGWGMNRLREAIGSARPLERSVASVKPLARAQTRPTPRNLANRLTAAPNKHLPADFFAATRLLRRPYFHLDEVAYQLVLQVAGDSDIVLLDGKQMTYGDADGGKALMPLAMEI